MWSPPVAGQRLNRQLEPAGERHFSGAAAMDKKAILVIDDTPAICLC
jgi:hypothetical protein